MTPKTSGTYWCNHCDDNAFSETCWRCHREATFMASPARTASTSTNTEPATAPTATVRYVTPPAEWFRRMRKAINT